MKNDPVQTTIHVKNMVCDRCVRVVREELQKEGYTVINIRLGEVTLAGEVKEKNEAIRNILERNGFELIDNQKAKLVEQLKNQIISLIFHNDNPEKDLKHYPAYLARKMGYDYHYLSSLFSSVENLTIEQYVILQKIERVKELLVYGELTLSEIAFRLAYSSVQHLSNQFKQITGFTPSAFKKLKAEKRIAIDRVGST